MKILGLDPSVNNVGLALWDSELNILQTDVFHPRRSKDTPMPEIGTQIVRHILTTFLQGEKDIQYAVMEFPQWENSTRGAIAMQQGYTLDLAYIVGHVAGVLTCNLRLAATKIFTPTPMEWKKNLPKDAVGLRFQKRYGVSPSEVSDHEFEAAMMIDWAIKEHSLA